MFCRAFGLDRKPDTLSRREWDRFIAERRRGNIAPLKARKGRTVGERIIEQDLSWLRAVLNWATLAGDGRGGSLLERNPLAGLPMPKEQSPKRAHLTPAQYHKLREIAPRIHPSMPLLLVMAHETGHRAASIRQRGWSDVDLEGTTIRWRAECDKIGYEHTTPLTDEALAALKAEQAKVRAIGDTWIFPSRPDSSKPLSGDAVFNIWKRAAVIAGLPEGERYGWHSVRRQFANELRDVPMKDLLNLGGWKNAATILTCYQKPEEGTQRAALEKRRELAKEAVS